MSESKVTSTSVTVVTIDHHHGTTALCDFRILVVIEELLPVAILELSVGQGEDACRSSGKAVT